MGVAISGLPPGTVLNETDVFEIEQAGVSKQITKAQLRKLMFSDPAFAVPAALPQNGDVVSYNGTDFITGPDPRWRVINQAAYTEATAASNTTFTFAGGTVGLAVNGIYTCASDYFSVGDVVRVVISTATYYGLCSAVTSTLLTVNGIYVSTGAAITSISVGTHDMVKHVTMSFAGTGYNSSSTLVLTKGCQHRWLGPTGYLVAYSCAHMNTSSTTVVTLQMNGGSNVCVAGVIPAAGASATVYGAFTDTNSGSQLLYTQVAITGGQTITAKTPTVGGSADFLIICMTFVVP